MKRVAAMRVGVLTGGGDCPGLNAARLPTAGLKSGQTIEFTWRSRESGRWLGTDHRLAVTPPGARAGA